MKLTSLVIAKFCCFLPSGACASLLDCLLFTFTFSSVFNRSCKALCVENHLLGHRLVWFGVGAFAVVELRARLFVQVLLAQTVFLRAAQVLSKHGPILAVAIAQRACEVVLVPVNNCLLLYFSNFGFNFSS